MSLRKYGSFSSKRAEWAKKLDPVANSLYQRRWDVVEYHDVEGYDDPMKRALDNMGIDKILIAENPYQSVTIAQRFRRAREGHDFQLRADTGSQYPAEKEKCLQSYRGDGTYPSVYAHGKECDDCGDFQHFHLIDFSEFLRALDEGELVPNDTFTNRENGSRVEYYSVDDIGSVGALMESWGEGW